jgi:microcystin-dependent protein
MGRYLTPAEPPTDYVRWRFRVPADVNIVGAFQELIGSLGREDIWDEREGGLTITQTRALVSDILEGLGQVYDEIGEIRATVGHAIPSFGLDCDGSIHNRDDYPQLYERLDPAFQLTEDTFYVPDLRGRFLYGAGYIGGVVGDEGGAAEVTLTEAELPSHTHTTQPHTHADAGHTHAESAAAPNATTIGPGAPQPTAVPVPSATGLGFASIQPETVSVDASGGGGAFSILPPFLTVRYYIVAK